MRKIFLRLGLILVFIWSLGIINVSSATDDSEESVSPRARKIVVFRQGVDIGERNAVLKQRGTRVRHYSLVNASSIVLSDERDEVEILKDRRVERIEEDIVFTALLLPEEVTFPEISGRDREAKPGKGHRPKPPAQPEAIIPWGIERIKAPLAWGTSKGSGVRAAILDTGIQLDHPDLKNNIIGGVNTINSRKTANDDNGHGTHVAGIVAALDNSFGVVGVAPEAHLYAVKVLGASGSGWLSDIIEGLEWCINNDMQIANMSFGSSTDSRLFREAIEETSRAGIVLVGAAGNEGSAVIYPAAYPEVIAVAASDSEDKIPYWSNSGPALDLTAPGVSIYSTYKGSTYRTLSGTSMASPHAAGVCALVLAVPKYKDLDPAQVKAQLETTAEKLTGYTANQQGAGLVRADGAVK